MKPAETARVLASAAAYDQRTVGTADVAAWHAALSGVDFDDARSAVVQHYQHHRERIMPADILDAVESMQLRRMAEEWRAENGHRFVPDEFGHCTDCGLPRPNRRHLLEVAA
jgi:hypothetical protein